MTLQDTHAIAPSMNRASALLGTAAIALASPLLAQDQIGTIERGRYVCELPGDASGAAGVVQAEEEFTIKSASRYKSPQGNGTYLRRGDRLTMTSGPRNGDSYEISGRGYLRKIDGPLVTRLRCVRQGS